MSEAKLARAILTRWMAFLSTKDLTLNNVQSNFEELFYEMFTANIPYETIQELLNEAISAHFPGAAIGRATYKKNPMRQFKSEKEFMEDWRKGIQDRAMIAFHTYYTLPSDINLNQTAKQKVDSSDKDAERILKMSKPLTPERYAEILAAQIEEDDE